MDKPSIYTIAKKIIEKCLPNEVDYFDFIWDAMKDYVVQWQMVPPDASQIEKCYDGLKSELGFMDEAQVQSLYTPRVFALLGAFLFLPFHMKPNKLDEGISKLIEEYGKSLPEWLRIKVTEVFSSMLREDIKKIKEMEGLAVEKEEPKYVVYSHKIDKPQPITESQYMELRKADKKDYLVWIDEVNCEYYIEGKQKKLSSKEIKILMLLFKKKGRIVSYDEIIELLSPSEKKLIESDTKDVTWKWDIFKNVYRWKYDLIRYTNGKLNEYIETEKGKGYRLRIAQGVKFLFISRIKSF